MKKFYFPLLLVLVSVAVPLLAYYGLFTNHTSTDLEPVAGDSPKPVEQMAPDSLASAAFVQNTAMQSGLAFIKANATNALERFLWTSTGLLYYNLILPDITQQLVAAFESVPNPDIPVTAIIPPLKPATSGVTNSSAALVNIKIPPSKPVHQAARNPVATSVKPNATVSAVKPDLPATGNTVFQQPAINMDPQYHGKVRVSMIPYTGASFATSGVVWEVYQNDPATKTVSTKIFVRSALAQFEFSLPEGNYVIRARYNNMTADLLVPVQAKHVYQYILNFYAGQTRLVADFANHSGSTEPVSWEIRPRSDASRIVASGIGHDSLVPLREGNYLVFAKSGSFRGQAPLEIRAGQTRQVNVTLQTSN